MIKTSDIKNALILLLHTKYPSYKIFAEQVIGTFTQPAFSIFFAGDITEPDGVVWQRRTRRINIKYYPADETATTYISLYDVADALQNSVIKNGFRVGARFFTISNCESVIVDYILNFSFTIEYSNVFDDAIDPLLQAELMQVLEMEIEVDGGKVEFTEGEHLPEPEPEGD